MRFVTRCPSCGTSFRVVVDQLKIADGWARCGWCQHVFDATQDLQPEPALAPGQPPDARVLPETTATPAPTAAQHLVEPPPAGAPAEPGPQPQPVAAPAQPEAATQPPAPAGAPEPEPASWPDEPVSQPQPEPEPEPAFVRQARRRARWQHPLVRAVLAAVALGLTGLLLAQVAWLGRAAVLARWPQALPWYELACQPLGCTVGRQRPAGAVVVEGSVLLRRAPDRYSFHLVLRNQADAEVEAPALELTLVDAQGEPLARRVWLPPQWPQPTERLAAATEWPLQFELAFDHPQASRMNGYRVVLFYP
ncbi:putative Zn finger-like uncharacterized protein [Tepidimonas ignava]|uniref:Putative Zn finger-like uncharacterized protein n=1 Tax=Tepidimonas ignava TaxID=114249 RepID=A0A4R3L6B8_9BURK|nr:zinc-ribbon and DUF3426 domain-containing protein [Tepidimonas ignava]TCS95273.1 putative Zn finger-like uncharacterized protein [Tepidimonas ignava]